MIHPVESTRDRLLDAAEGLFSEHGYDAIGIRQIAEVAGVNLSGIKYHFGSKRGLYLEAIRRTMDRRGSTEAWALISGPMPSRRAAADALAAFVGAFLRVLLGERTDEACLCLIMQSAMQPGDATDLVVREFVRPHHERLCGLVGVLCPEADARARSSHAQAVMGLLMHQRMFRLFLDRVGEPLGEGEVGEAAIARLADELTAFSLRGMGCGDLVNQQSPAATRGTAGPVGATA